MRKTIAKAVTWRLIGTAEIFAISFWTTGHIATAGHTAGIAAVTSLVMYVIHESVWEAGIIGRVMSMLAVSTPICTHQARNLAQIGVTHSQSAFDAASHFASRALAIFAVTDSR
jgi:uncharacterized membrane protein